jgi:hypothetical protein
VKDKEGNIVVEEGKIKEIMEGSLRKVVKRGVQLG